MTRSQWLEHFGTAMKKSRLERRWTQQQLADRMSMSRASVANIEAGRQETPASVAARLVAVLGFDTPKWAAEASELQAFHAEITVLNQEAERLHRVLRDIHRLSGQVVTSSTDGCVS